MSFVYDTLLIFRRQLRLSLRNPAWVIIGLIQQMSTLVLPLQLQNATIFVVFVLILLFRPQGLFGRVAERA